MSASEADCAPASELFFPIVRDRHGPRLALVFGNEAPDGLCPFYRASLCHHCDIGLGEGKRFDVRMNTQRIHWFTMFYNDDIPKIAHLVIYNSGSTLNQAELSVASLDAIIGFARGFPALRECSLDTREGFVEERRLLALARALGAGKGLRPIIGLESSDDAIRDGLLEKRMSRAAVERAIAAIGRAARAAEVAGDAASIGLSVNVVIGGPGAAGARAADDARASAAYALSRAIDAGVPLDLNLHPYYPSARGLARFPGHPRPALADVIAAVRAIADETRGRAGLFLGLHDEGHDRRPDERTGAVTPLRAALERFHETQDPRWLDGALEARET